MPSHQQLYRRSLGLVRLFLFLLLVVSTATADNSKTTKQSKNDYYETKQPKQSKAPGKGTKTPPPSMYYSNGGYQGYGGVAFPEHISYANAMVEESSSSTTTAATTPATVAATTSNTWLDSVTTAAVMESQGTNGLLMTCQESPIPANAQLTNQQVPWSYDLCVDTSVIVTAEDANKASDPIIQQFQAAVAAQLLGDCTYNDVWNVAGAFFLGTGATCAPRGPTGPCHKFSCRYNFRLQIVQFPETRRRQRDLSLVTLLTDEQSLARMQTFFNEFMTILDVSGIPGITSVSNNGVLNPNVPPTPAPVLTLAPVASSNGGVAALEQEANPPAADLNSTSTATVNVGAIVAVVGALCGLLLVVLFVVGTRRRRHAQQVYMEQARQLKLSHDPYADDPKEENDHDDDPDHDDAASLVEGQVRSDEDDSFWEQDRETGTAPTPPETARTQHQPPPESRSVADPGCFCCS